MNTLAEKHIAADKHTTSCRYQYMQSHVITAISLSKEQTHATNQHENIDKHAHSHPIIIIWETEMQLREFAHFITQLVMHLLARSHLFVRIQISSILRTESNKADIETQIPHVAVIQV